jgi:NTP pyrophosphatase (non-canonical NTP hydrolase)
MDEGMSLNEYQRLSTRTLPAESDIGPGSMSCLGMGIAGEAGEVSDFLKKVVHHGHPDDARKVFKELGDVLWYLSAIATRYGYTLEEVAVGNIDKLMERYPEGFTSERSVNRAQDDT